MPGYAPGIQSKSDLGDPTTVEPGSIVPWVVQQHKAERAGEHSDIRFGGGPDERMFSFATKKPLPGPGGKISLFQQPLHDLAYQNFQGRIRSGYGKGDVSTTDKGEIVILSAKPGHIVFATGHEKFPARFALVKDPKNPKQWLLSNITPEGTIDQPKVRYQKVPTEEVEKVMPPKYTITPKIDGAAAFYRILRHRIEAYSYRTSTSGKPIIHTERIGLPMDQHIPARYEGTLLRGELYGTENGRAIPPQQLGGILNSTLAKSLRTQREKGIKLENMLFGIRREGSTDLDAKAPYREQIDRIKRLLPYLPKGYFNVPEEATTPEEAAALVERIKSGKHPLTSEGVVAHPNEGGAPVKAKFIDDNDVVISGVFPGQRGLAGKGAGGFTYALEPGGDVVGKVGTGFSADLRADMLQHPEEYIGRVAKIRSQGQFPSGAYRAPAFHALHEDPSTREFSKKSALLTQLGVIDSQRGLKKSAADLDLLYKTLMPTLKCGVITSERFEKVAGSLGRRIRAGLISPEGLERGRVNGFIRPVSTFERGLERGSVALARELGLGEEVTRILTDKNKLPVAVRVVGSELKPAREVVYKSMPPIIELPKTEMHTLDLSNMYQEADPDIRRKNYDRDKMQADMDARRFSVFGRTATPAQQRAALYLIQAADGYGGRSALQQLRVLRGRHEIDEFRSILRRLAKTRKRPSDAPVVTHNSAKVLLNEGENVQGLGVDAINAVKMSRGVPLPSSMLPGEGFQSERQYMTEHFSSQYPRNLHEQPGRSFYRFLTGDDIQLANRQL